MIRIAHEPTPVTPSYLEPPEDRHPLPCIPDADMKHNKVQKLSETRNSNLAKLRAAEDRCGAR
jgi:uncharacterized membrane protein YcaP (DUF421 family)